MPDKMHTCAMACYLFASFTLSVRAQPIWPPDSGQFDLSGEWAPNLLEDWFERLPGPALGDYTGIPLNEAGRQKADTWDAATLSQPERQTQPHPAVYSFRGPNPHLRWEQIRHSETGELIGYRTSGTYGRADRTIWLDGRPHPSDYALHTWSGFSTGRWVDSTLIVTTTHMKAGTLRRNGVPSSAYAVMTEYWFRQGTLLTMVSYVQDPIYLEEPFIRSQSWILNPSQEVGPPIPFESVEEVDMTEGTVPHWPLGTKHSTVADRLGIKVEGTDGGAATLYPEYRRRLQEMRAEYDAHREDEDAR